MWQLSWGGSRSHRYFSTMVQSRTWRTSRVRHRCTWCHEVNIDLKNDVSALHGYCRSAARIKTPHYILPPTLGGPRSHGCFSNMPQKPVQRATKHRPLCTSCHKVAIGSKAMFSALQSYYWSTARI